MEAFLLCLLSITLINQCSARYYSSGSSSGSSSLGSGITAAIVVSIVVGSIIFFIILFCILKKCPCKRRMGVLPLSTQAAIAQQEHQYAPPGYYQAPPYGQPPPYEYPPPYQGASAPTALSQAVST